jgi:transcriptional regulator GlxA family with amidase domain
MPAPEPPHDRPVRVGLLLFEDVDLLDVGGPYEVFLTANRLAARNGAPAAFEVVTMTPDEERTVTAYGGLGLVASHDLDTVGPLDVAVVPGTIDLDTATARPELMAAVTRLRATPLVATVCTGAVILARAGGLDDVDAATTHHEDVGLLADVVGARATTARWVDAGPVVTAGGLSSGIAMALHLVARLVGRDLAIATAAQVEYDWDPDDGVTTG